MKRKISRIIIILSLFALSSVDRVFSANGLQLIGFSAESTALAGAGHVAIADTSSINTNPAALSLIKQRQLESSVGPLQVFLDHSDVFGNNDAPGQHDVTALGGFGFATRFASLPRLTVGAGIFTQGGFGTKFLNVNTAFGTSDKTSSFLRYLKFAVGLSYDVTDKFSIGIAPGIGYSDITLQLFPATSVPTSAELPTGFAGLDIHDSCSRKGGLGTLSDECPSDLVFSMKLGVMYRALPELTVGATYTSLATFDYTNGKATLNFSAFGLGNVDYRARVSGITWPRQVDVSIAASPTERLIVAQTTSWINWATIHDVDVIATNPNNILSPSEVKLRIPFNWKNQLVLAFGLSYIVKQEQSWKDKDRLVLRLGYNHSNNPIPHETLNPLAPLILQHHFTGGFGWRFTEKWAVDLGVLYALKSDVTYTNTSLPFGSNAAESISGYWMYNTISYKF